MALLNIFKKEKSEKEPQKAKKVRVEERKEKSAEKAAEVRITKEKKTDLAWRVLKTPHVTEKGAYLSEKNQYIFNVYKEANKVEIKKAIRGLYGVDVIDVNIINMPRKRRRLGRIRGWRPGYKKAIVKIRKDQKIEVMPR